MFFYTIMKLFITLLEDVNKSRTSAGRLSLTTQASASCDKIFFSAAFRVHQTWIIHTPTALDTA
jgi:hypothetical protein